MKRLVLVGVMMMMFLVGCGCAAVEEVGKEVVKVGSEVAVDVVKAEVGKELSSVELWNSYNAAKAKMDDAKSLVEKVAVFEEKALYAAKLKRDDIAAWQYNNIGYAYIEEFSSTKDKTLLIKAKKYLDKAKKIDAGLDDERRTKIIAKNLAFIEEHLK